MSEALRATRFEDNLHCSSATRLLQLADIVAHAFVIAAEKLAYRHHDINLRGSVFHG